MAGQDRMTIEEVVRRVLREEHGDVIREHYTKRIVPAVGGAPAGPASPTYAPSMLDCHGFEPTVASASAGVRM